MDRLETTSTLLLLVDVQERLLAATPTAVAGRLVKNLLLLVEAARVLGVEVIATEQYPKGLGPTVAPLADHLRALGVKPIHKMTFDAASEPSVALRLAEGAPRAVVLAGLEAHVCIFQTARELARRGTDVRVVADAVASRQEENR
ncbi:MAG: isochorismatase family protein, partial [Myxococcota bacterium]|nr:isochorismatase family protein [Myxococcota bacterium]